MMFKKDTFIKWSAKDESGSYEYIGQFKMMHGDTVIFDTAEGMMGVHKEDGTFTEAKKPKGWSKGKSTMHAVPKPVVAAKAPAKGSKMDKAITITKDLYGKGHGKDATVQRIMDVCEMSKAGATTYFYSAKKLVDQGA